MTSLHSIGKCFNHYRISFSRAVLLLLNVFVPFPTEHGKGPSESQSFLIQDVPPIIDKSNTADITSGVETA